MIWMVVDIEPGFRQVRVGDHVEAPALWIDAGRLPESIMSMNLPVTVRPSESVASAWLVTTEDGIHAFLLNPALQVQGPAVISGCLEWDRYPMATSSASAITRGKVCAFGVLTTPRTRPSDGEVEDYEFTPMLAASRLDECTAPADRRVEMYCIRIEVG
jgi:hypothetical protein